MQHDVRSSESEIKRSKMLELMHYNLQCHSNFALLLDSKIALEGPVS